MIAVTFPYDLPKLGRTLPRSGKRCLHDLPGGMSRPPCALLVLARHHTAYPAWQAIRCILHRADPIGPQQRQLIYEHIHIFNSVKPLLTRDLLVQLMEHFPLIAQFHSPPMPILFRPPMCPPQLLNPRLARLARSARHAIERQSERLPARESKPRFLHLIAIPPGITLIARLGLGMAPT